MKIFEYGKSVYYGKYEKISDFKYFATSKKIDIYLFI